jgi:glutaredoxin 3
VAQVTIYSKTYCPYCDRAKSLLASKGVAFEEINLEGKPDEMQALVKQTGMRTVPQIFINGKLVGGFTDLAALEQQGKLDALLAE